MEYQGRESMTKGGCDNLQNISATGAFTPVSSKIALGLGGLSSDSTTAGPPVLFCGEHWVLLSIYLSGPSNPALGTAVLLRHTGWFSLNNTSVACASIIPLPGSLIKPHNFVDPPMIFGASEGLWELVSHVFLSGLQHRVEEIFS